MRLIHRVVPNDFNIFLYGDAHKGSTLHYAAGFRKFVEMVNSEYNGIPSEHNYPVDHGDCIEAIMVDDKRYDPRTCDEPFPLVQLEDYEEMILPFIDRLVVILDSNHFQTLRSFGDLGSTLVKWLHRRLNVKANDKNVVQYGTYSCKINWKDKQGRTMFKTYHTHGRKGISSTADDPVRREANMKLILKRHLREKASDCILMCKGHTHKLLIQPPSKRLYIYDDGHQLRQGYTGSEHTDRYINENHRWYVNTGAFYKIFGTNVSSYAEIAEYDPIEQGFAVAMVRDRKIVKVKKEVV